MRKIHPGFKALAILLGPASIIIGHQKITEHFQQDIAAPSYAAIIRQAYVYCSELPQLQRHARCDEYLGYFEQCAAQTDRCDPRSVYEVLIRLNLPPVPMGTRRMEKIAVSDD